MYNRAVAVALLLSVLVASACAVGPDYRRPDVLLPEQWPAELVAETRAYPPAFIRWWERFEDPTLNELVARAVRNNFDIEAAAARVVEARSLLGVRHGGRFPTIGVGVTAERESENDTISASYEAGITLDYELDLFGRLARSEESARARLLATAYSQDAIRLAVVTDVVVTYFNYRAVREQISTTEHTIVSQAEALALERSRHARGASTELAVRQSEAELETVRAQLPGLRSEAMQYRRALALLVGETAQALSGLEVLDNTGLGPVPRELSTLPEFMPSELLERRPDIRAAEAYLIAANADIGAARANWFPRVNLAAILGVGAGAVGDLFGSGSGIWELAGSLSLPILDFGQRRGRLDEAEALHELAELQYRTTIGNALREVGDAWTDLVNATERLEIRQREVRARQEVVRIAARRYQAGYTPYLEVLDARRALYQAQLSLTAAARDRIVAAANLHKALGGE